MIVRSPFSAFVFSDWWDPRSNGGQSVRLPVEISYLVKGGALATLRGLPPEALFDPRQVQVTEAAIKAFGDTRQHAWSFLVRHLGGDWGLYGTHEDRKAHTAQSRRLRSAHKLNQLAVRTRMGRVASAYPMGKEQLLWIITHLEEGGYTSILLPGDV